MAQSQECNTGCKIKFIILWKHSWKFHDPYLRIHLGTSVDAGTKRIYLPLFYIHQSISTLHGLQVFD